MKPNRFLAAICLLATALAVGSCTQDSLTDGNNIPLPEGKYPLQITGITMTALPDNEPWDASTDHAPQTRVSENTTNGNSSVWTDNDEINVRIGESGTPSTYEVTVSGSTVSLNPTGDPLSWTSATPATVYGWFPTTSTTVDLSNQTSDLAYVLFGQTKEAVSYATDNITIVFTHKLAKIRVDLKGDQANLVNKVEVLAYSSCTFSTNDGTVTATQGTQAYIPMMECTYGGKKYWEANVVPDQAITKIQLNGSMVCDLTSFTPQVAKVNIITLTAGK
ncbi:fimbrillin family protein [Phocaeicola sp.]